MSEPSTLDPRIDRGISMFIGLTATVALALGAWFFNDLRDEQRETRRAHTEATKALGVTITNLQAEIGGLRAEVAVLKVQRNDVSDIKDEIRGLRKRLRAVEQGGKK